MKKGNLFRSISRLPLGFLKSIYISPDLSLSTTMSAPVKQVDSLHQENQKDHHHHSKHYMKMILDLCYFTCVIPYHIKYDIKLKDFIIHRNKIQRVFCVLFQLLTILGSINHIYSLNIDKESVTKNPSNYFYLFRRTTLLIFILAWFKTSWGKANELRMFVKQSYTALPGNYLKTASRLTIFYCVLYTSFAIAGSCFIVENRMNWNLQDIYIAHLKRATKTFNFLDFISTQSSINIPLGEVKAATVLIFEVCHDTAIWSLYLLKMGVVIFVWMRAKSFSSKLSEKCLASPQEIIKDYGEIKELFNCVSSILGWVLLTWVTYVVPFTAIKITDVFLEGNWFVAIFTIVYFSHVVLFFVLAADASAKVKCLRIWLIRDDIMTYFDLKKYNALLMELSQNSATIESINGVFSITYGFIGNIFTLMTSFFIMIIQFKTATSTF